MGFPSRSAYSLVQSVTSYFKELLTVGEAISTTIQNCDEEGMDLLPCVLVLKKMAFQDCYFGWESGISKKG